jgi:cytochrome c oxidase subunit 2
MAAEVDWLHVFVIGVTMFGAAGVTVLAGYYTIRFRQLVPSELAGPGAAERRRGATAIPLWVEASIVVGLLALFVTWWVIGFRQYVAMRAPPESTFDVYVSGKQWMWTFAYPDGRASNGVLVVPANRPVKLIMTSRDVIHSFFVPEFRLKQDVVPGRVTTLWFEATVPGRYQILCAEYCGTSHSTMRGEVLALSGPEFERYIEGDRQGLPGPSDVEPAVLGDPPGRREVGELHPDLALGPDLERGVSLAAMGEQVAGDHGCLRCHTVDGTPHLGPTWLGLFGATILLEGGTTVVVDEAYLTESMMDPMARVHAGFAPIMPSYMGLLSVPETAALVAYIKDLRAPSAPPQADPLPAPGALEVKP